jgi:glutamate racemase
VSEGAFSALGENVELVQIKAQRLVGIVERGEFSSPYIDGLIREIKETDPDALILGCTHFSHLSDRFLRDIPGTEIFSPASIGAQKFSLGIDNLGEGRIEYVQ